VAREQRLVYGEDPELYERVRPGYPDELIEQVVALVGAGASAVDAGCGTGKAAVLLAARGLAGVGVDPDPAMAEVARRRLAGAPGWRVDVSAFEDWSPGPDDGAFDLVVSAQAWHWFQPEAGFRKAHALLRPGGWLALWWNGPADFDSPARRAIDAAYATHAPEIVYRGVAGHPRPEFGPVPAGVSFGPPVLTDHPWTCTYTAGGWVDLVRTSSDHRMLPEERREKALAAVARAIEAHGGTYDHPYLCGLCAAQRL
jgi:SAM-dependent methyltransferase